MRKEPIKSGWLPFLVLCNGEPIMSAASDRHAAAIAVERSDKYPKNSYAVIPNVREVQELVPV